MEDIEILDALNYFSEFLKECLSDNDWTIKHFADLIDCNPQAVGFISSLPAKDNTNRHNKQILYNLHVRFILQKRV